MVTLGHIDSLSNTTIYRKLAANEIKPWRLKSWCIGKPSAKFVAKMEDVLDVYAQPYDPRFPVVCLTERRTSVDFAEELRRIVEQDYCQAEKVVLITDNLNTHTVNALYEAFEPEVARRIARKVEWHYTPEHASWLNIAEIELAALATQCFNRRIASKDDLERQTTAWQDARNQKQARVVWQFRTEDARIKLRRLYPGYKDTKL